MVLEAAVIPSLIVHVKSVAGKNLVVGFLIEASNLGV